MTVDLHKAANTPGWGTGRDARREIEERLKCRRNLPDPSKLDRVFVDNDDSFEIPIANFGCDDDGMIVRISHSGTDDNSMIWGQSAVKDAETVAAIMNAYRLGVLVVKDE